MEVNEFFGSVGDDATILWRPWKKKFAFLPKKLLVGKTWFTNYYERTGRNIYGTYRQRGTLFDVIKEQ